MKKTSLTLTKFMVPWMLGGIVALIIYLSGPYYYTRFAAVASTFFFAVGTGAVTSILLGIALDLNPVLIIGFIVFLEADISLFIAWNFDVLKDTPLIGKVLMKYETRAKRFIKKKRLESVEIMGLIAFVLIPFHGTGAVGGTIIGRILGMGWKRAWLCVTIGCSVRTIIITLSVYSGYISLSGILP